MISEQRAAVLRAIEALSAHPGNEELLKPLLARAAQYREEERKEQALTTARNATSAEDLAGELQSELQTHLIEFLSDQLNEQVVSATRGWLRANQLGLVGAPNLAPADGETPAAGFVEEMAREHLSGFDPTSDLEAVIGPMVFIPAKPANRLQVI